jgi:hypothetical protein
LCTYHLGSSPEANYCLIITPAPTERDGLGMSNRANSWSMTA